ncbi:MAG: lipocalin family protein, partial [Psychrobacter sp.]
SAIIHKSANTPTTVDSVDLKQYAGTWYEIGRLPMYFQRNCASDVTANYAEKTDSSGITVTNKCVGEDGAEIVAEGLAKPDDDTGSKLKVTFLPSWIRWLPVGRADYWVLARDADYKTALVGTPDKDYLWLLARSPNISQETYSKYRQIAQQQGYDLKEFKLTPQTNQTINLVP